MYCAAVSEGTTQDWDYLWGQFKKADVAAEQIVILGALGCTKNATVLKVSILHTHQFAFINRF